MKKLSKKTYLKNFGIGIKKIQSIYNLFGYNLKKKNIILKKKHRIHIYKSVKNYSFGGTLKFKIKQNIAHYKKVRTYRGTRHQYHYPVRGQRTHTNAKTQKRLKNKI